MPTNSDLFSSAGTASKPLSGSAILEAIRGHGADVVYRDNGMRLIKANLVPPELLKTARENRAMIEDALAVESAPDKVVVSCATCEATQEFIYVVNPLQWQCASCLPSIDVARDNPGLGKSTTGMASVDGVGADRRVGMGRRHSPQMTLAA